jgi:hypothetical protein
MRWPSSGSKAGLSTTQPVTPTNAPASAPPPPTTSPLASSTSRMCRWLAPMAPSMPSARSRRWAMTWNPATDSRPTKTSPIVASTSTRVVAGSVSSLRRWVDTPSGRGLAMYCACGTRSRASTRLTAAPSCPGATRANGSLRLSGFSTTPTTVHGRPAACQGPPTCRPASCRTRSVTAISPEPCGHRPPSRRSIERPYGPLGTWARRSTPLALPGTGTFLACSMTSTVPKLPRSWLRSASCCAPVLLTVTMWSAVPNIQASFGALPAMASPMVVAATASSSSVSTTACWRHSRRNSRQAQRTTARRAGIPPLPVPRASGRSCTATLIGPPRRPVASPVRDAVRCGRRRARRG